MRDFVSPLTLGVLAVLTIVGVFASNQLTRLDRGIADVVSGMHERQLTMQTFTEEVTVGTRKITVSTTRQDGETLDAWIARHNAAVAALG